MALPDFIVVVPFGYISQRFARQGLANVLLHRFRRLIAPVVAIVPAADDPLMQTQSHPTGLDDLTHRVERAGLGQKIDATPFVLGIIIVRQAWSVEEHETAKGGRVRAEEFGERFGRHDAVAGEIDCGDIWELRGDGYYLLG